MYGNPHCTDKTIVRPSYLILGIPTDRLVLQERPILKAAARSIRLMPCPWTGSHHQPGCLIHPDYWWVCLCVWCGMQLMPRCLIVVVEPAELHHSSHKGFACGHTSRGHDTPYATTWGVSGYAFGLSILQMGPIGWSYKHVHCYGVMIRKLI